MSVSTEVQRTLVKSPPELWAELSTPEGLARQLGEVGAIRITAIEPETQVEWEADETRGTVHLKQSGWGTRVTLSLTRELPAAETSPEPDPTPDPTPEPEPDPTPEPAPTPEPDPTPEPTLQSEPAPEQVVEAELREPTLSTVATPESKQGFFARLFKRRQVEPVVVEPEPRPTIELQALSQPEPIYPKPPPKPPVESPQRSAEQVETVTDLGLELADLEAQMERESAELLTSVLDRLGAAHHRPFSRA